MPGSSCTSRLKAISSCGLATSFRYAVASLMCACSKNRMPLVMEKGMLPLGQFELQFQRVKMRAVKHGHLVQAHAFLAQFQHALGDERGLLRGVHAGDQRGFQAGFARRRELSW